MVHSLSPQFYRLWTTLLALWTALLSSVVFMLNRKQDYKLRGKATLTFYPSVAIVSYGNYNQWQCPWSTRGPSSDTLSAASCFHFVHSNNCYPRPLRHLHDVEPEGRKSTTPTNFAFVLVKWLHSVSPIVKWCCRHSGCVNICALRLLRFPV